MKITRKINTFLFIFVCLVKLCISHDYFDLDDQVVNYLLQNVKLRKCSCQADEVIVQNECVAMETYIPVLLFHDILEPLYVNASTFHVIPNSGLKCGFGKSVTKINPMDFFVLSTGQLLHVPSNISYSSFEFCVNHILNKNHESVWEVEMCTGALEVPICCPFKGRKRIELCMNPTLPVAFGYSTLKDPVIKSINSHDIKCKEDEFIREIDISDPSNPLTSVHITYDSNVTQMVVYSDTGHVSLPKYLNKSDYCLVPSENENEIIYKASFCSKDPIEEHQIFCKDFSCVRKCCKENEMYSFELSGCINYEKALWKPVFYSHINFSQVEAPANLKMNFGFPICKRSFYSLKPDEPKDRYALLTNGEMHVYHWERSEQSPRYCIDNFILKSNEIIEMALTCFPDSVPAKSHCSKVKSILFPILLLVSCIFLIITLVVYASIPELHAKLHGKSLLSHISALSVAYFALAIVQWGTKQLSMGVCRTLGFVVQISFLAAFFWLNVMCFDIWWTLRSMRPVSETSDRSKTRFVIYSIYAWGSALTIGVATIVMETVFKNKEEYKHLILPGFGQRNCWFQDNIALWVYFYGFVFVLTLANITFFIFVAMILMRAQRANDSILRTTSTQHKERVWIYLKLFVVMGVTWICEVISWHEGSCEYWLLTDIINALQGFFIFLIFICKKNICVKLHTRGTDSTRKLKRMVQGSSSYGSSTQVTQQTSLDSTRKYSSSFQSSLQYHLSKLNRNNVIEEKNETSK